MMVGSIIIECLGRQNMTFEGSINHGWIYALMGVSKTEASLCNGLPRELLQMEWLESSTVPLPKSLPIIISPCEVSSYEAVKWSFSIVGHYLLVEAKNWLKP